MSQDLSHRPERIPDASHWGRGCESAGKVAEDLCPQPEVRQGAALLDLANDAIFVADLDGKVTYWNRGAERLYGWTSVEILGKDETEVLRAEFPVPYGKAVEQLIQRGHWEGEVTCYRRNGEPLIVSSRWSLVRNPQGAPVARMVINTDLTQMKIAFSELHRAEAEARARATELAAILDAIPGATFIAHDPACRTMTSSRAAYELLRLPPGTNTSKSAPEDEKPTTFRIMKDGRELAPEELPVQRAAATGEPIVNAELTVAFNDGTERNVLGNAVPLRNDAGQIRGAVGSFIDVTTHNLAVKAAREREALVHTFLDCSTDFVFLKNTQGHYLAINAAAAAIAGKKPEDFLGKDDFAVFPPDVAERHARRDRDVIASGAPASFEDEIVLRNEVRHLQTVKNVCRDSEGRVIGVVGISRDITAEKQAEAKERNREAQFLHLAESLPQMVWVADAKGLKTYCNRRYLEFTGISSVDEMNSRWQECVHPDDRELVTETWIRALATGETYTISYRLRRHDGVYRHVLARAVPVGDDCGEIDQWLGTSTDIHEQKLAEDVMRRTEKLATAARIAASIAHEINNPLASVTNALYLALQAEELSPKTRQYLKLADRELSRVAQVTTQTLRFHKQSSAPVLASLSELIDGTLAVFAPRVESLEVRVEREYRTEQKLFCFADELRQAFGHVAMNSLDAMAHGGNLRVRIWESRRWDESGLRGLRITIADSGTGIPAELRSRVFEAFVSTKDPTGTGLGLWVVEGIVRKHRGNLWLRSSTDPLRHGTVLTIFLPFAGAIG